MNPLTPREELEIRITALLMGQLAPEEAAELLRQIAEDPELITLHARLRHAVELLREARALPDHAAPATPLVLSKERREKLLATFRGIKALPSPTTLLAPKPVRKRRGKHRDWNWVLPMTAAAAAVFVVGAFVFPIYNQSSKRTQATAATGDLRMLDDAIEQTAKDGSDPESLAAEESRDYIRAATKPDGNTSAQEWASQPGAIQTLDSSTDTKAYALYAQQAPAQPESRSKFIRSDSVYLPSTVAEAAPASGPAGVDDTRLFRYREKAATDGAEAAPASGPVGGDAIFGKADPYFQRFPGHPATTALSPATKALFPNSEGDLKTEIYRLQPRIVGGIGSSMPAKPAINTAPENTFWDKPADTNGFAAPNRPTIALGVRPLADGDADVALQPAPTELAKRAWAESPSPVDEMAREKKLEDAKSDDFGTVATGAFALPAPAAAEPGVVAQRGLAAASEAKPNSFGVHRYIAPQIATATPPPPAAPMPAPVVAQAGEKVTTLDLFNMPVAEPHALSEPLSTAGKVNLGQSLTALNGAVKQDALAITEAGDGTIRSSGNVAFTAERELQRRMLREEVGKDEADKGRKTREGRVSEAEFETLKKEKLELQNTVASLEETVKAKESHIESDTVKLQRWEQNMMQKGTVALPEDSPEGEARSKAGADRVTAGTIPGLDIAPSEAKPQTTDGEKPQAVGRYGLAAKSDEQEINKERYNKSVADEMSEFGEVAYSGKRSAAITGVSENWQRPYRRFDKREAEGKATESNGTVVADGGAVLDKSGAGTLTITGATSVNGGTLQPNAANPLPALNTPTPDAGIDVMSDYYFDTPKPATDAQQWAGATDGRKTVARGNIALGRGGVSDAKGWALFDESLAPEVVEFEGFINYGTPIQTKSKDANGVETENVITSSFIGKKNLATNAPQLAADDGLAQLGDLQIAPATLPETLAYSGLVMDPTGSSNSLFTAGGTRGTSPQMDAADSVSPIAEKPITGGNRSGSLAISANAIDALLFGSAGSSAITPEMTKELEELRDESPVPAPAVATKAKPARTAAPAKKPVAKNQVAGTEELKLAEQETDFALLDLATVTPQAVAAAVPVEGRKLESKLEEKTVDSLAALTPPAIKEEKASLAKAQADVSKGQKENLTKKVADAKSAPAKAMKQEQAEPPASPKPAEPPPTPQPEIATSANAFSTFSLNVADVSFKLAGAALEKGAMPDVASVRSEEFINALDYRDAEPAAGAPLAFASERARYPFAHNRDLLRLSVKTAAAGRQAGRPLNLVLLLDNSGSMERSDRVRILREALTVLAKQLQPADKLSIITFSRTPRLWADGVAGNKASEFTNRVGEITPQGGTDLGAAIDLGYTTALKHYQVGSVNRVVLLTDGAANLGNVSADALKTKVETHRKQGVAFDCFGVGWEGYNDDLLEQLSRNGDGRYGFINTPEAATTEFAAQLAGSLRVAASDVKVQVEFNPKRVTSYRQLGYAKHQLKKEQFRDNTVDAAEIGAAESGNTLYTVELNPRGEGDIATVRVRFKTPGTGDYHEHEWTVPFSAPAPALEQSSSTLRLAATAGAFAEMLAQSPFAAEVTTDKLLAMINGIPAIYGADPRPAKLEWMLRQAKSISGK